MFTMKSAYVLTITSAIVHTRVHLDKAMQNFWIKIIPLFTKLEYLEFLSHKTFYFPNLRYFSIFVS